MQLKTMFRKSAELGIALVALSALVLVGCGGGGSSGGTGAAAGGTSAALSAYITDAMAGNIWSWSGIQYQNASGVIVTAGAWASKRTLTATATANTYTSSHSNSSITLPGVWTVIPNTPQSGVTTTSYSLTSTGWAIVPAASTIVVNGGSVTVSGQSNVTNTVAKTDLSGSAVACTSPMGSDLAGPATYFNQAISNASCAVTTTYPAGAVLYTRTEVITANQYYLYDSTGGNVPVTMLTDSAGVQLNALPTVGTTFCQSYSGNGFTSGAVYVPIVGAAVGADNYGQRSAPSCAQADIAAAVAAGPANNMQTMLIASKSTGMTGVTVLTVTQPSWTGIFAFHLGKFMTGDLWPAGTYHSYEVNKLAANAQLTANGIPTLP